MALPGKSFNWTVSDEVFDSGDTFAINIGGDNSYTYTASSGDGRNELSPGLVSRLELNWMVNIPLLQLKTQTGCQI